MKLYFYPSVTKIQNGFPWKLHSESLSAQNRQLLLLVQIQIKGTNPGMFSLSLIFQEINALNIIKKKRWVYKYLITVPKWNCSRCIFLLLFPTFKTHIFYFYSLHFQNRRVTFVLMHSREIVDIFCIIAWRLPDISRLISTYLYITDKARWNNSKRRDEVQVQSALHRCGW